ncbi:MAG: hypothetical protein SFY92_12600 [Verrucomicrobiae bacterium]|nr:hypothetical protein [Verrucomicrobiae bacterium]
MKNVLPLLCSLCVTTCFLVAADPTNTPAASPASPASSGASEPVRDAKIIDWSEHVKLMENLNNEVTVEGVVVEVSRASSGKARFINFEKYKKGSTHCHGVVFKKDLDKDDAGWAELFNNIQGQRIRITGTVTNRDGAPQIKIDSKSQIEIVK